MGDAEAEETLAKRKELAKHRQGLRNPDISVAELFGEFFQIKRRTLSASGFERYEGMFRNYVAPEIGNLKVSDLRPEHLIDAYAKWSAKGVSGRPLSGRTVHHLHDLIRCALNFGIRREWLTRDVAACLETEDLPKAAKPEPIALNKAEMAALLNAAQHPSERAQLSGGPSADPWFYPAVAFAMYTGVRRGEVLGLRWSDILRTGYKDGDLDPARPDGSLVNPRCFGNRVIKRCRGGASARHTTARRGGEGVLRLRAFGAPLRMTPTGDASLR